MTREAARPSDIPLAGWRDIVWRLWGTVGRNRLSLVAAGTTFFLLLALFPGIVAFVSIYGFVASPTSISGEIAFLGELLPQSALALIRNQLDSVASANRLALGDGLLLGLLFSLWSANRGVKTLFEALNVAYEVQETRSFVRLNLVALVFTLGGILTGFVFLIGVGIVPAILLAIGAGSWQGLLITLLRWPLLLGVAVVSLSVLYRYGPSREPPQWRWVVWGAGLATAVWIGASIAFSYYLQNFAHYNATYGSLGATIGLLMWIYISVFTLLAGAELNSEIERQTARDSTTERNSASGERGAVMTNTLGKANREQKSTSSAVTRPVQKPD